MYYSYINYFRYSLKLLFLLQNEECAGSNNNDSNNAQDQSGGIAGGGVDFGSSGLDNGLGLNLGSLSCGSFGGSGSLRRGGSGRGSLGGGFGGLVTAAGAQRQTQDKSQQQSSDFFHGCSPYV